jgi:hypothetical protein
MDDFGPPGGGALSRQMALVAALRGMGDPRFGGALPPGGKAGAMGEGGLLGRGDAAAAYDALANMREQELEDLAQRPGGMSRQQLQR